MTRFGAYIAATTLALSIAPAAGHERPDQPGGTAALHVKEHERTGEYLVDREGMSVYLFEADTQGAGDTAPESTCYGKCAQAWPPVVTGGEPEAHDDLDPDLLGTIQRRDGDRQVTYGGWPLYYFAADQSPGHARGHDVELNGGEWYLVSPEGGKAGEEH